MGVVGSIPTGVTVSRFYVFMETLDIGRLIHEHLRDNLRVNVYTEREYDYSNEYTTVSVSVSLRDPSTGEWIEIDEASDCIYSRND